MYNEKFSNPQSSSSSSSSTGGRNSVQQGFNALMTDGFIAVPFPISLFDRIDSDMTFQETDLMNASFSYKDTRNVYDFWPVGKHHVIFRVLNNQNWTFLLFVRIAARPAAVGGTCNWISFFSCFILGWSCLDCAVLCSGTTFIATAHAWVHQTCFEVGHMRSTWARTESALRSIWKPTESPPFLDIWCR